MGGFMDDRGKVFSIACVLLMIASSAVVLVPASADEGDPGWERDPGNDSVFVDAYIHQSGAKAIKLYPSPTNFFNTTSQEWDRIDTNISMISPNHYSADTSLLDYNFLKAYDNYLINMAGANDTLDILSTTIRLEDSDHVLVDSINYVTATTTVVENEMTVRDAEAFAYEAYSISPSKCTYDIFCLRDVVNSTGENKDELLINISMDLTFNYDEGLDYFVDANDTNGSAMGCMYVTGNDWSDSWEIGPPSLVTNDSVVDMWNMSRTITLIGDYYHLGFLIPYNNTYNGTDQASCYMSIPIRSISPVAAQDAMVLDDMNSNFGNSGYLMANYGDTQRVASYVGFQGYDSVMTQSGMSKYSLIDVATLKVYQMNTNLQSNSVWGIYDVLNPWDETKIKYSNQPSRKMKPIETVTWNGAGTWRSFNVKTSVQRWTDQVDSPYGFYICRKSNPNASPWPFLFSSEYSDASKRPYLYIEWHDPVTRFIEPPTYLISQETVTFQYYITPSSLSNVHILTSTSEQFSTYVSGSGLKTVTCTVPTYSSSCTIKIHDHDTDSYYDAKTVKMVYASRMDQGLGEWTFTNSVGGPPPNGPTISNGYVNNMVLQMISGGGMVSQDYATLTATSPFIPWGDTGPVVKVSWKVLAFGVLDKGDFPQSWNNGRIMVVVRVYDVNHAEVTDNNGQAGYGYILAGDRGDATGAYHRNAHSHCWQCGNNLKVLDHIDHSKMQVWQPFDRSLHLDYTAMRGVQNRWLNVAFVRVQLILEASGTHDDAWEILWDDLVVGNDEDVAATSTADSLADFEEDGSNCRVRYEAENPTSQNGMHGTQVDASASGGAYIKACHDSNQDWVAFNYRVPAGRYRVYVNLRCLDNKGTTTTGVQVDGQTLMKIKTSSQSWERWCVEANFMETGDHEVKLLFKKEDRASSNKDLNVGWDYIELLDAGGETYSNKDDDDTDFDKDGVDITEEARFNGIPSVPEVFLEVDWMTDEDPDSSTLANTRDYFLDLGIVLWIDLDEEIPKIATITFDSQEMHEIRWGEEHDMSDDGIRTEAGDGDAELDTGYQWWGRYAWGSSVPHTSVYRYCVWASQVSNDCYGYYDFYGAFYVFNDETPDEHKTFMHELGHAIQILITDSGGDEVYCTDNNCVMKTGAVNTHAYCSTHRAYMDLDDFS